MLVKKVCQRCHLQYLESRGEGTVPGWTKEIDEYWEKHRIVICPSGFVITTPSPSVSPSYFSSPSPSVSPSYFSSPIVSPSHCEYYPKFRKNPFRIVVSFLKKLFSFGTNSSPNVSPSPSIFSSRFGFDPARPGYTGQARFTKKNGGQSVFWIEEESIVEVDIDTPPPWCEYALEHLTLAD